MCGSIGRREVGDGGQGGNSVKMAWAVVNLGGGRYGVQSAVTARLLRYVPIIS